MTSFSAFTGASIPLRNVMFNDFVSDVTPFGIARSNVATGNVASSSISNSSDGSLGVLTISVGSATTFGTAFARCGVYLAEPAIAPTAIDRAWQCDKSECYVESRIKTDCSNASTIVTVGLGLGHASSGLVIADYLVGFYSWGNEANWTAAVVSAGSIVTSKALSVPKKDWSVLSVELKSDNRTIVWHANGAEVFTKTLNDGFFVDGNSALPQVETRDKTSGGSGAGAQNTFIDYLMVADKPIISR